MLLCECLSVLAGHCVVWLSDSHSLKVWLFVSNLFATPGRASACGLKVPGSIPDKGVYLGGGHIPSGGCAGGS